MKKLNIALVFLLIICLTCIFGSCSNNEDLDLAPSFSADSYSYDINGEAVLIIEVDLKGIAISNIKIGEASLKSEEYTLLNGKLTISNEILQGLELGDHTLSIATEKGLALTTLKISRSLVPPVFDKDDYSYDISIRGNLEANIDLKGASIKNIQFDQEVLKEEDYVYDNGKITIYENYFIGVNVGDHTLSIETTKGATTVKIEVIESASSPEFANKEYVYDLSIGGELDLKCNLNNGTLVYLMVEDTYLEGSSIRYENGAIRVAENEVIKLGKGEFTLKVITDEGSDTAKLSIINTVETSFDKNTIKNYAYGQDDFVEFEANFDDVTISKVLRGEKEVNQNSYSYEKGSFKLYSSVLDLCYGETEFTICLSNNENYSCSIASNVMFYTDYDNTTIHDEKVSEIGHNSLYINSYDVTIADGFDGKALKWQQGDVIGIDKAIMTIRNSLLESSMWHGVEIPSGKYLIIEFDYASYGTTLSDNYIFQRVQNSQVINETFATPGDGQKMHASYVLSTNDLHVFCLNFITRTTADQYLLIDNYRVILVDNVAEQSKALNDQDANSSDDLVFDFNSYGLQVENVAINNESVAFSHNDNKITIANIELPKDAGKYTISIETKLYTAVYTVNFTSDSIKVEINNSTFNYSYGGSDIVVSGTFGERVEVLSLTRQSLYDVEPITVNSADYSFDTVTGVTIKASILDKLYGSTKLVLTTTGNVTTELTINSNVLFYTDYDNTTIHDDHDSASVYNCLYINSATISLVEGLDGTALKYQQGSVIAPAEAIYTIRNTLLESSLWLGVEMTAGKYIVVEFDYASYGTTSNDNYIFQRVQNGQVINETFATPGDGQRMHASYVVSTDGLQVICLNYLARTTADQYLLIDNFRVTLVDTIPTQE